MASVGYKISVHLSYIMLFYPVNYLNSEMMHFPYFPFGDNRVCFGNIFLKKYAFLYLHQIFCIKKKSSNILLTVQCSSSKTSNLWWNYYFFYNVFFSSCCRTIGKGEGKWNCIHTITIVLIKRKKENFLPERCSS